MARKARLFVTNAIYHVYCRTARGERVFSADAEAEAFVGTVQSLRDIDRFDVLAWALLGNHYHLVLKTCDVPLWRSMARLQGRIGRDFNRRHGYLGRLWQSRYKARVIDSERYYAQVIAYVHLNPVAAGIVGDPAEYRWSGHSALIGRRPALLINIDKALRGYGQTTSEARRRYLASVRAVAEARWLKCGPRYLPWWVAAQDDETIAEPHNPDGPVTFDGVPIKPERPAVDLQVLGELFCRSQGVELDDLAAAGRANRAIEARIALTAVAVLHFDHAVKAIARLLNKNPGTVSKWLAIARDRQRDPIYRKELEATSENIIQLCKAIK